MHGKGNTSFTILECVLFSRVSFLSFCTNIVTYLRITIHSPLTYSEGHLVFYESFSGFRMYSIMPL